MASVAVGEERRCPICQKRYTEPVSLRCGQNFCWDCIVTMLDGQEESGEVYTCTKCREKYPDCPLLESRILVNNVENTRSMQETTDIFCTYCVDSPVAAVKTCLHCETSLCDKHLKAHNKVVDHVLLEPTLSLSTKKCSIHKLLEYYCTERAVCLCASCLSGKHKGHKEEHLKEDSEEQLKHTLENLTRGRGTVEERIQILQDHKKKSQEQADYERKKVRTLFHDIRRHMKVHENIVLSEISRQKEQILLWLSDQIHQLERKRYDPPEKLDCTENPSTMVNSTNILQEQESETGDQEVEDHFATDLDDFLILFVLHKSITDFIMKVESRTNYPIQKVNDLFLDAKTAHNLVALSYDLKVASSTKIGQKRRDSRERFTKYRQVLSMERFSGGRHYWEVEVSDSGYLDVGVCYESIERKGEESSFGENKKSWCIGVYENEYFALHNSQKHYSRPLDNQNGSRIIGIYLDYDAGCLSFYQLGDPIKRLHVFTATFTESLRAAFYVNDGAWVRLLH